MKVPAQQSSCVVLSAIFFSTTISSQDSIKYLEDLDAERFCIFITHSDHPGRCVGARSVLTLDTLTVIPRRTLTGSVRLKSYRVFQPNETTGCPPCAHERPAYTNHPKMCTIPLSAFYYRSTHLWSNHWITIYHRIYYSSIWQGCKLQQQVTTFIQLEDKPGMELPPNIVGSVICLPL
jgi:hypothetical protein